MLQLYNLGIRLYFLLLKLASAWNPKAAKWVSGRRGWRNELKTVFSNDDQVIWFHCASLGEFEQGRPLIEKLKSRYPEYKLLLSFFSPSGYDKRKNYDQVDHVCYLPKDSKRNARDFLSLVPVKMVFFIKYEFWYHFLNRISNEQIPLFLASGNFQKSQVFFHWYGAWYRKVFGFFTQIFVQDEQSASLLALYGYTNVTVAGDTRFDRVINISEKALHLENVEAFSKNEMVIIAGSTWEKDEDILKYAFSRLKGRCKLILAPHEPSEQHLKHLKSAFPGYQLFSELRKDKAKQTDVLLVDTIGHLSSLYRYGSLAYIGGGFGKGIHNVLEAAAAGLPVLFGPNFNRFVEARELLTEGAAFVVQNHEDALEKIEGLIFQADKLKQTGQLARKYTILKKGATDRICYYLSDANL